MSDPAWAAFTDEQLLEVRMCDLGVTIEGTDLEARIAQLNTEMDARGLTFRPYYWLSDEWFTPDGVPGIAIPFYLAHPRLAKLEFAQMLEVEGGDPEECLRILRAARRHEHAGLPPEDQMPSDLAATMIEEEVIAAERDAALRAAFAELPRTCHELLSMLMSDPPPAYTDVSATLGMAVGSIGPMRARCLDRLRRSQHLVAVLADQAEDIEVMESRGEHRG